MFVLSMISLTFAVPVQLSQQGKLLDASGVPVTGQHQLQLSIYDAPFSGSILWEEVVQIDFVNGHYSVILGGDTANNPLEDSILAQEGLFLEMSVDGGTGMTPRQPLISAPFARRAGVAEAVDGGVVDASEIKIGGNLIVDQSGTWIGATPDVTWNDVQNIPSDIADGDDNTDVLAGISCVSGEIAKFDGALWYCDADMVLSESDVETFITNAPINLAQGSTVAGAAFVALDSPCQDGQVLLYNIAAQSWGCGQDTDTTLTESEVRGMVSALAIDLAAGSTMSGSALLTADSQVSWSNLTDVPNGLDDGDDGLSIECSEGEILTYTNGQWTCAPFNTVIDADGDGALTWNDCDDSDASIGNQSLDQDCDGILSSDDCDDDDPNSTTAATDADCDSVLTDDDCDDNNGSLGAIINDADCDGATANDDCDDNDASVSNNSGTTAACAAASCLEIFNSGYSTGDGSYFLNINGSVDEYTCDMTNEGWTILENEDFSNGADGWSGATSSCGSMGTFLGGYGVFGTGSSTAKNFETLFPHTEYSLTFDFIRIDSWDNESAYAYIDGTEIWTKVGYGPNGSQQCGQGHSGWHEEKWSIVTAGSHTDSSLSISFDSNINEGATNESWGIDNVVLKVK